MKEEKYHILIVDDNLEILEILSEVLKAEGYQTACVSDANEALTVYKSESIDLAIVDMLLPDRSGLELIKEMWKQDPALKMIAISGGGKLGPKGYLNMANRIGVEYTFPKPFDIPELIQTVKELLENSDSPNDDRPEGD